MPQTNATASPHPEMIVACLVLVFCGLLGLFGNLVVVVVIIFRVKLKNFTRKVILHLAISGIVIVITVPVWIYDLLMGWDLDLWLCSFFAYILYCSTFTGVYLVSLLSVQRYIQVLYVDSWGKLGTVGENAVLGAAWVLGAVFAVPTAVVRDRVELKDRRYCRESYRTNSWEMAFLAQQTLTGFIIPFSIMVIFYVCLHKRLTQSAFFRSAKLTKLITGIIVTFVLFWTPVHLFSVLKIFAILLKDEKLKAFCVKSWDILKVLPFVNISLNPFLYAFAIKDVQRAALQLVNV